MTLRPMATSSADRPAVAAARISSAILSTTRHLCGSTKGKGEGSHLEGADGAGDQQRRTAAALLRAVEAVVLGRFEVELAAPAHGEQSSFLMSFEHLLCLGRLYGYFTVHNNLIPDTGTIKRPLSRVPR
jgi:hypothetical protein